MKICSICNSDKTTSFFHKKYNKIYPMWYIVNGKYVCSKCKKRLRDQQVRDRGNMPFMTEELVD